MAGSCIICPTGLGRTENGVFKGPVIMNCPCGKFEIGIVHCKTPAQAADLAGIHAEAAKRSGPLANLPMMLKQADRQIVNMEQKSDVLSDGESGEDEVTHASRLGREVVVVVRNEVECSCVFAFRARPEPENGNCVYTSEEAKAHSEYIEKNDYFIGVTDHDGVAVFTVSLSVGGLNTYIMEAAKAEMDDCRGAPALSKDVLEAKSAAREYVNGVFSKNGASIVAAPKLTTWRLFFHQGLEYQAGVSAGIPKAIQGEYKKAGILINISRYGVVPCELDYISDVKKGSRASSIPGVEKTKLISEYHKFYGDKTRELPYIIVIAYVKYIFDRINTAAEGIHEYWPKEMKAGTFEIKNRFMVFSRTRFHESDWYIKPIRSREELFAVKKENTKDYFTRSVECLKDVRPTPNFSLAMPSKPAQGDYMHAFVPAGYSICAVPSHFPPGYPNKELTPTSNDYYTAACAHEAGHAIQAMQKHGGGIADASRNSHCGNSACLMGTSLESLVPLCADCKNSYRKADLSKGCDILKYLPVPGGRR